MAQASPSSFLFGLTVVCAALWYGVAATFSLVPPGSIYVVILGVVLLWFNFSLVRSSYMQLPVLPFVAALPVVLVSVVSAILQGGTVGEFLGRTAQWGTVAGYVLFLFALLFGYLLTRPQIFALLHIYAGAVTLLCLEESVRYLSTGTFAVVWVVLPGLIATAFIAVVSVISDVRGSAKYFYVTWSALLFLGLVALCRWEAVVVLLVSLLVVTLLRRREEVQEALYSAPAIGAVFLAVVLFFGLQTPLVSVPNEIRPSLFVTHLVSIPAFTESVSSMFFGTGPRSFEYVWEKYQPPELQQTPLAEVTLESGHNTFYTTFVELGVLGGCALLFVFGIMFARIVRIAVQRGEQRPGFVGAFGVAVFVFGYMALYTPTLPLILLGGLMLGAAASYSHTMRHTYVTIRRTSPLGIIVLSTCMVLALGSVYVGYAQARALWDHEVGAALLATNTPESATLLVSAAHQWPVSLYASDASRASVEAALHELEDSRGEATEVFVTHVDNAIELSTRAVSYDPKDWRAWSSRASLNLSLLGMPVASTSASTLLKDAQEATAQAQSLTPTRPEVFYLAALVQVRLGNKERAISALNQALFLRPTYAPARELLTALK